MLDSRARNKETLTPYPLRNEAFASALLDPDIEIPEGVGKGGNTAPKRFSVYRNNVVVSLVEALKAAFPSIHTIMGEENFSRVARNYVAHHPPASAMMQQYGDTFASFLADFKPLQSSPFLVDLAQTERAWLDAYHAVDERCLTPEELGSIPPETTLKLCLSPLSATRLIRSAYPICDLFNARNNWPQTGIDLEVAQNALIARPGFEVAITSLDQSTAWFVDQLVAGSPLGEAIERAHEVDNSFEPAQAISILLQTGAFKSLSGGSHLQDPN